MEKPVVGRRKRDREQDLQAAEAVRFLEEVLDHEVKLGLGEASHDRARYGKVAAAQRLLSICGNDPNTAFDVLERCWKQYDEKLDEVRRRSQAAEQLHVSVGMGQIAHLFDFIYPYDPAFDAELVADSSSDGTRIVLMFPELLKLDRERSGLSVGEAARRLHVSPAWYLDLEAGKRLPDWETYDRICKTFGWPQSFR